jgi:hypothetical protein
MMTDTLIKGYRLGPQGPPGPVGLSGQSYAIVLAFTGGAIPAGTQAVNLAISPNFYLPDGGSGIYTIEGVEGTLSRVGNQYTFARSSSGAAVPITPGSSAVMPGVASGFIRTFPTVAALQASSPPPASGYTAKVLRYSSSSTACDIPEFIYDATSTRNDCFAIKPNAITGAGRWVMPPQPFYLPEWAGARGDGVTSDTAAFQRLSNYLEAVTGGGEIRLTAPSYNLAPYLASEVNGRILYSTGIGGSTVSGTWHIGSNTKVTSSNGSRLLLNGLSTSFYGYGINAAILTSSAGNTADISTFPVTLVAPATQSITVANSSGLVVGDKIIMGRLGGVASAEPNTASQEIAPNQFLTIKSISGNVLTFEEGFIQDFINIQNLVVIQSTRGGAFPANISFENITFDDNGSGSYYILFSKTSEVCLNNCRLIGDGSGSFGTCERISFNNNYVESSSDGYWTIEAVNHVQVLKNVFNGKGSSLTLGGLFVNDNVKDAKIDGNAFLNYPRTALAALYGYDGEISNNTFVSCGTVTNPSDHSANTFAAAVSLGFPMQGAIASRLATTYEAFQVRQSPISNIEFRGNRFYGRTLAAIRGGNVNLTLENNYFECAQVSGSHRFIIWIGETGNINSAGGIAGRSRVVERGTTFKVLEGNPVFMDFSYGWFSFWRDADTATVGVSAAGQNQMVVSNASNLQINDLIYFYISTPSGSPFDSKRAAQIAGIAGNTLTLVSNLSNAVPAGTAINHTQAIPALLRASDCETPINPNVAAGWTLTYVDATTPATLSPTLALPALPSSNAIYTLEVQASSANAGHQVVGEYEIVLGSTPRLIGAVNAVNQNSRYQIGNLINITSVTLSGLIPTINFSVGTPFRFSVAYKIRLKRAITIR